MEDGLKDRQFNNKFLHAQIERGLDMPQRNTIETNIGFLQMKTDKAPRTNADVKQYARA